MLAGVVGVIVLALLATTAVATAATPKSKLANVTKAGNQTSSSADDMAISKNGQYVVWVTSQNGVVPADSNNDPDVFIRNIKGGSTRIVSLSNTEAIGNGGSWDPVVSGSGRYVAFGSDSSNLVNGFSINDEQIFLRDRKSGTTKIISQKGGNEANNGGAWDAHFSDGARYIVFTSNASNLTTKATGGHEQIYLYDRFLKKMSLVSRNNAGKAGTDDSFDAQISQGGRYIVFTSRADNMVFANDKGHDQVYLHDRKTKKTRLISKNKFGKAGNESSNDGEISAKAAVVVFESDASNLLGPGRDTNGNDDVFMRKNGKVSRVSLNWNGKQLKGGSDGAEDPDISVNGRWLVFESDAKNATKAGHSGAYDLTYLRDLKTGKVTIISRKFAKIANAQTGDAHVSDDGRFVVIESNATNLIPGGDANGSTTDVLRRGPYHK
jgi:hypothetical protein